MWDDLGIALGVRVAELDEIKTNNSTVRARMKAALLAWLQGRGKDRSWKSLCEALRDPLVGRPDIASTIELSV